MNETVENLTNEQKEQIEIMFFGPFKEEWKDDDGLVDNSVITIAKRVNGNQSRVNLYINKVANRKFNI